jgi:peptidylprolyl isomerase
MSRSLTVSLTALAASILVLAGCTNTSTTPTTTTTVVTPSHSTTTSSGSSTASSAIAPIPTQDRSPGGKTGVAPTIIVPPGTPPTQLESADLIVGTGSAATAGESITVQYVLATYSARKVIQSSWTSQPFVFTLGEGQVIPGWDKGVLGMKVGGRRELIIPPSLGYGEESPGAGIAVNDTLVFIVDLLKIG